MSLSNYPSYGQTGVELKFCLHSDCLLKVLTGFSFGFACSECQIDALQVKIDKLAGRRT